jgi:hypothetical protein
MSTFTVVGQLPSSRKSVNINMNFSTLKIPSCLKLEFWDFDQILAMGWPLAQNLKKVSIRFEFLNFSIITMKFSIEGSKPSHILDIWDLGL